MKHKKFEYQVKTIPKYPTSIKMLNEMGQEGWELVQTIGTVNSVEGIFKREIIEEE